MISIVFIAWAFIGFALFTTWLRAARVEPGLAPGGGVAVMLVIAFGWPVVLVLVLLALLMRGINEAL